MQHLAGKQHYLAARGNVQYAIKLRQSAQDMSIVMEAQKDRTKTAKKEYRKPEFNEFGRIADLTAGGSVMGMAEMGMGMGMGMGGMA